MKKLFILSLLALGCMAQAPLSSGQALGNQWSQDIATSYKEGDYQKFLNDLDADYQNHKKNWKFDDLLENRKKIADVTKQFESSPAINEKDLELQEKVNLLKEKRNRKLMKLCTSNPHEEISQTIRNTIFFTLSEKEEQSLSFVNQLETKFKGEGKSPLENKLIDLDIEYWLKGLHLGTKIATDKLTPEDYARKLLVLKLEKLKRMEEICQNDEELREHFTTVRSVLPRLQGAKYDENILKGLGKGKIEPKNDVEKKVKVIMTTYLEEKKALITSSFSDQS